MDYAMLVDVNEEEGESVGREMLRGFVSPTPFPASLPPPPPKNEKLKYSWQCLSSSN